MAAYSESGLSVPPTSVRGPSPTGSLVGSLANSGSNTGEAHRIATLPPTEDQTAKAFSTSSTTAYQPSGPVCEPCQAPRPGWTPGQIGQVSALGVTTLALVVTSGLVAADMHTRRQQDRRYQSGSGTELADRSTFTTATPGPTPLQ